MRTCSHCKQQKPEAAFSYRNKALGILQDSCKLCASDAVKASCAKHATVVASRKAAYRKNMSHTLKASDKQAKLAWVQRNSKPCPVPGCVTVIQSRSVRCKTHNILSRIYPMFTNEQLASVEKTHTYGLRTDKWARAVKRRDGYACVLCGSGDKPEAHHILSVTKHPEFVSFIDNGITLCEPCHVSEHQVNYLI